MHQKAPKGAKMDLCNLKDLVIDDDPGGNAPPMQRLETVTHNFQTGVEVMINGLQTRTDLNGRIGYICTPYDKPANRIGVDLAGTLEFVRVKPENLQTLDAFAPRLYVMTSNKDLAQAVPGHVSEDVSPEMKRLLYVNQCQSLMNETQDGNVCLPIVPTMRAYRDLPGDVAITPMYFRLTKLMCEKIDEQLELMGMTYAVVCTELTDTDARSLMENMRPPLEKGQCRIRCLKQDDIKMHPRWAYKNRGLIPLRAYYVPKKTGKQAA